MEGARQCEQDERSNFLFLILSRVQLSYTGPRGTSMHVVCRNISSGSTIVVDMRDE